MDQRWIFDGHIAGIGTGPACGPWWDVAGVPVRAHSPTRWSSCRPATGSCSPRRRRWPSSSARSTTSTRPASWRSAGRQGRLTVDAGPLRLRAGIGGGPGWALLRTVPRPLAVHPRWLSAVNPLAGRSQPRARTSGTAGNGRQEYYGVTDLHRIDSASVSWDGTDAGAARRHQPPGASASAVFRRGPAWPGSGPPWRKAEWLGTTPHRSRLPDAIVCALSWRLTPAERTTYWGNQWRLAFTVLTSSSFGPCPNRWASPSCVLRTWNPPSIPWCSQPPGRALTGTTSAMHGPRPYVRC